MKRGSLLPPLVIGAAVFVVSLFGLINLTGRPGVRRDHLSRPIVGIDSYEIRRPADIRFVLSRKRIGDSVEIRFGPDGGPEAVHDTVVPYYSQAPFPFVFVLLGGLSFLAGFGVLIFMPADRRARIFYWLCVSFGATVVIGSSTSGVQGRLLNLLPGILFNFAYPLTLAILLWFARSYAPHRLMARPTLFWVAPLAWGVFLGSTFLVSELGPSIGAFRVRAQGFHVFRLYVVAMGVAALVEFARAFRSASSEEDRAQIKWYFIGLAAGLGPYLAFSQLPLAFTDRPLLPEDFASAFFFLLPVFMASVILQFRLLRVNIVFHRGLVYAILTVFTLCAYLFAVEALRLMFPRATATENTLILVGAAAAVALLLSPGRRRIQDVVDKLFFRQAYDYRKAVQRFRSEAPAVIDVDVLTALFSAILVSVLPVTGVAILLREAREKGGGAGRFVGMDEAAAVGLEILIGEDGGPWARPDRVRGILDIDFSRKALLESAGAAVALAMPPGAGTPAGLLAFGPKTSGHRFTREDIDLIEALSGELAVNLGRIRIQEEMIYERASREKSEELVRMKTEFISTVSHELRTPLTSLNGLTALLRSGKIRDPARRDRLLGLMANECDRLTRFLTNVLDYGKIEGGAKVYVFKETALGPLVREVADLVRESLSEEDADLKVEGGEASVTLQADPDAVRQALLNLIDNALKYSPGRKEVTISLIERPDAAVIAVKDRGMGIAPEDRERIFEAFFRSPRAVEQDPTGVGLGLRIVSHIAAAHGGRVEVESEPGRGSVFSLVLPRPA